jgi:tetratricopeptide (TPR) repeat protein
VQATRRLALLAYARADYELAERLFAELLNDRNTVGLAVYYLSVISERRGDVDSAMKGYQLLAQSGFDDGARRRVASLFLRDGERTQAIRLLSAEDGAEVRDRISAELAIASLLAEGGAPQDAISRLDTALLGAPGHPDLAYQRAVYQERVDPAAAIETLEALHKLRPQDMTITNALGFTLADHGRDLSRAESLIRTALRATPDNPAVLDSVGWVLHKRGKSAEALPYLQRAWRMYHDGDIGSHYGEVLWALGRKDEARAQWRAALAVDPDNQLLLSTARQYAPELSAPVPQPRTTNVFGGTAT